MKTFIKIIEIWNPSNDRKTLSLTDSYYGIYEDFNKQSMNVTFRYNEGLPGKAWSQSCPIVITDLNDSCFIRKEAAKAAGIQCAIGVPVFSGQFLLSVIVFLCGGEDDLYGAIEVWGKNNERKNEMHFIDGYYGSLQKFGWISRRLIFQKGKGLPGMIWDYRIPQIVEDLSDSGTFLRASNAQLEGITTVFGIPLLYDQENEFVLTFLSANGTPIARRIEIWLPDREHTIISMYKGHSEIPNDLFSSKEIKKGQGFLGQVWQTGCPGISHNPIEDGLVGEWLSYDEIKVSVALPIIEDGVLKAITVLTV